MSACWSSMSILSSSSLFLMPFMLTCSITRFLSFFLQVLGACVVRRVLVLSLSFVGLLGCLSTLCGDCIACGECFVIGVRFIAVS